MSDGTTPSPEILINVKGPNELKLQITISTDKTVLELKQAIAEQSEVAADRQRLIYAGRVLKDEEVLTTYKIQSNNTIHMVKSAAVSSTSSQSQPQRLPNMQAGQNPHDPLTQLNSHLGYGALAGVNPFAEMGLNQNDPNMFQSMMNSPQFLQQMASLMSNPSVVDQIIASNPDLAAMGPQVRDVFQSERFQEMISDPERLRGMIQMASMMQGGAGGPGAFGGLANNRTFPTLGAPLAGNPPVGQQPGTVPANPLASFFPPPTAEAGATPNAAPVNPFNFNPALMQQFLGMNTGGLGGGLAAPAAQTDARPPEERYQVQLQQLQDMGFVNAAQNVRALLATGGNVHSAIEYILSGGGL